MLGVSSRLARGRNGRIIVIQTTPEVGLQTGATFLALGNDLQTQSLHIGWLGEHTGHAATVAERVDAETGHGVARL
jgi:hypothetical protein